MKSLNDNYVAGSGSSHETFSDLMFCALIVLVLFIMALAIEVSTRVKASTTETAIEKVEKVELSTMTKEEVAELSEKLQKQQVEMDDLKEQLAQSAVAIQSERHQVQKKMAALNGEQRFTGAREKATLNMAYDYNEREFHFVSAREMNHADTSLSGESALQSLLRKKEELVDIALKARKQRGFSFKEATAIYQAFSKYKEVEPNFSSYKIIDSTVGISYSTLLSAYIAGDTEVGVWEKIIVDKLRSIYENKGEDSELMYPRVELSVDVKDKTITINGIKLSPRDTKELLLSIGGRGVMIDLEGLSGSAPEWLTEEVLIPAGYISKTPKVPSE